MKGVLNNYLKAIMYTFFGILLAVSTYIIIFNIHNYLGLSSSVKVSEIDSDYSKYKDNVNLIEEKIKNHHEIDDKLYLALSKVVNNLKKNGVFRLVPNTELKYQDLYELNDYFLEELINNGWIHNLKELDVSKKYQDTITILTKNSIYLESVFANNSLILYDDGLDNKVEDDYHYILNNYLMYSNVILHICDELGGINGEVN